MSEEAALSTHIRKALYDTAAWSEVQDSIRWVSEQEIADIERLEEMNARN